MVVYAALENLFRGCHTLEPVEVELIHHLSAAGIAKINSDCIKGSDLTQTLTELKLAYAKAKQRRTILTSILSVESKQLLSRLTRPPTTDELAMFAYMPTDTLKKAIADEVSKGEAFDDIVDDLSLQYKQLQLQFDGTVLAEEQGGGVDVYFCRLSPTVAPPELNEHSLSMAKVSSKGVRVGFSPHTVWFHDSSSEHAWTAEDSISVESYVAPVGGQSPKSKSSEFHCSFEAPPDSALSPQEDKQDYSPQQKQNHSAGSCGDQHLPALVATPSLPLRARNGASRTRRRRWWEKIEDTSTQVSSEMVPRKHHDTNLAWSCRHC